MGKMVLYFGKLNLVSGQLFEVYNKKMSMHDIMFNVLTTIQDGASFKKEFKFQTDDGEEVYVEEIKYNIAIKEKTDTYIQGYLYKNSKVIIKNFNRVTKQLDHKRVDNDEGVEFYFDVFAEMVGYYTANRLGHKEFREAFCGILNKTMKKYEYVFELEPYTEGLSLDEIKSDLRNLGTLQRIEIKYHIPNPGDEILERIQNNGEKLENYKKANLAKKSILLSAASKSGINMDSEEVNKELDEIENMHSSMDAKVATKNAYVEVNATNYNGVTMSTKEKKPIKKEIKNIIDFKEACADVIKRRKH